MRNNYLNLDIDDLKITQIIKSEIKKLNPSMTFDEFKKVVIELDNIRDSELTEDDEDLICDVFNNMNKKLSSHLRHHLQDTSMTSGGITFGEFSEWLLSMGS